MTFSVTVPNASQSPGLFPAQNNTNFQRLKDIINADHNFTDSMATSQGAHRQVTMIDRTAPGSLLGGTNGIIFSEDVDGASQLRYYNGSSTYNLTPSQILIEGTESLAASASTTIYADPGFLWAGTGWALIDATDTFRYYNLLRAGSNDTNIIDTNIVTATGPAFFFSSNDLTIRNLDATTKTVRWLLNLYRIS